MTDTLNTDAPSRFVIGIDLGTTNSSLAYVDTTEKKWVVRDLSIPQLAAPAMVESRQTLPSFHYESAAGEFPPASLRLPWSVDDPSYAVGAFARDHGSASPSRLVVSAKSWLSHSGVDRTAGLLPWHAATDVERLSPVEVSARYLAHLRNAWDQQFPQYPLREQDVALAVPASFDEVARELTLQAAKEAGLVHGVLVEEPQAAFYAWIHEQGEKWDRRVKAGQKILVCDIGGGTSDFTLIRVRPAGAGKVLFHRVAVGEHLILGGDNLDLAIAHFVEQKIGRKLEPRNWGLLLRASRRVKETFLGPNPPQQMTVNVSAGGSKVLGGGLQIELVREEVLELLLEGFLPGVALSDKPVARRSGFQEFGLPYARDAAITRYLAAFLTTHRNSGQQSSEPFSADSHGDGPDLVLFNGGLFESPVLRDRLLEVLSSWFINKPVVLKNDRLDLAVSRGAAYYGMVRRGLGVRISGGLAHSYYIGVESKIPTQSDPAESQSSTGLVAVCLLPAGVEEGQTVDLSSKTFKLLIRHPVEFPLYASSTRTTDGHGGVVPIDREQMTALPPIRTVLQSGKKGHSESIQVRLHARLTAIGTLDIWCAEVTGDRTWRLQFDVRSATRADALPHDAVGESQGVLDEKLAHASREKILAAFKRDGENPQSLIKSLEEATSLSRHDWPPTLLRGIWETVVEVESARRISETHEARWLNLSGYSLRPGYGLAADDWRVAQTWKLFPAGIIHAKNELIRAEWWILWRRLAGGMNAGQQRTLAEPLIADWRMYFRKAGSNVRGRFPTFQFGPHESAEVWRLLGSLELLSLETKLEIGGMLLDRLSREGNSGMRDSMLFALGRLGARIPMYGPLNSLVPVEAVEEWAQRLMKATNKGDKTVFAIMQLCRRTGDRYRDVAEEMRSAANTWLTEHHAPDHFLQLVSDGGQLQVQEQRIVFGESLPRGLRIE